VVTSSRTVFVRVQKYIAISGITYNPNKLFLVPETPQNLQLVQKTTTTTEIMWSAVKGAVQYEVIVVDIMTSETQIHRVEESNILLSGLTPGKRYSVTIRSVGVSNQINSVPSGALQFQTGMV